VMNIEPYHKIIPVYSFRDGFVFKVPVFFGTAEVIHCHNGRLSFRIELPDKVTPDKTRSTGYDDHFLKI